MRLLGRSSSSSSSQPASQEGMRCSSAAPTVQSSDARLGRRRAQHTSVPPVYRMCAADSRVHVPQVCRELRREYGQGELPIIMVACSALEEDVIKGLAMGANDYMIK